MTNLFDDLQKMAERLAKDPSAGKFLRDQFRQFQTEFGGEEGSEQSPDEVLDKLYTKLKQQFEHVNSPSDLGDTDE